MKRTILLTSLLILGLISSQIFPIWFGELPQWVLHGRQLITMVLLSYIMIEVGREFEIDLKNKRKYAVDYGVAATAAAFPWIFVTVYFLAFLMPENSSTGRPLWIEALLAGRFAAPTSAGVLFSMLVAAGLGGTWAYQKTRILAIFDDLDTVLFMIPLKILMVGLAWQLGVLVSVFPIMLFLGWRYYRKLNWPTTWPWILFYSILIGGTSEFIYAFTKDPITLVGVHLEVLLPAFLLGTSFKSQHSEDGVTIPGEDEAGMSSEEKAGLVVSCAFMLFVGFSMPAAFGENPVIQIDMSWGMLLTHVLMVTLISNIGKMFAAFCYRKEASFKERIAVSVAMFPRGEVGAGVLAVSLSYGIQGPFVTVGFLSLALNLILTGFFILIVKRLLDSSKEDAYVRSGFKGGAYAH